MGFLLLAGAIAAEVAATTAMKYTEGFSRLLPSLLTVLGYVVSFALLAQTLKTVPVGTAYAIWAGVGTAAIATLGIGSWPRPDGRKGLRHRADRLRRRGAQPGRGALMPRRHDPERRQRIIDAAIRVVGAKGLAGLSHRTVAAEADVPLGSTTYHFKTLDELMVAALRQANECFAQLIADRDGLADPRTDLAADLASLRASGWPGSASASSWSTSSTSPPCAAPPSPVAAEWADGLAARLALRPDPVTARALVASPSGIWLLVLLTAALYDQEYARQMLVRVIDAAA